MSEFFRAGVGMVLRECAAGQVLVFERTDLPGSWQYPQGGIEAGEEPVQAVWRELYEETGLSRADVELVDEYPAWTTYELTPDARSTKTGRGQTQRWFLFDVRSHTPPIVLGADTATEFRDWRWVLPQAAAEGAAPFRRAVYAELATWIGTVGASHG